VDASGADVPSVETDGVSRASDTLGHPVPRRYRVVPARTRSLAGTAHARSLAPWSAGHAREGIWCRVGTRWYPEVPASHPAPSHRK